MSQPSLAQPKRYQFAYATTIRGIASGGSGTGVINVDAEADFVCQAILLSANFSSNVAYRSRSSIIGGIATGAITAGVGGTPTASFESVDVANGIKLPRAAAVNAADATTPGLHLLRVGIAQNNRDWQSQPIRADLLTGEPGALAYLPQPVRIDANSTVAIQVYNDLPAGDAGGAINALRGFLAATAAAITVEAQVVLWGFKQLRA